MSPKNYSSSAHLCRTRLKKSSSASSARFSTVCQPVRHTPSCLTQSVTSAVRNKQFNYLFKTKINRRGLTKDCLSCVHARYGHLVWLHHQHTAEENLLDRCRQKRRRVLCSSCRCCYWPTSTPAESLLISSLTGFLLPEM